jgi:hypothetical protein
MVMSKATKLEMRFIIKAFMLAYVFPLFRFFIPDWILVIIDRNVIVQIHRAIIIHGDGKISLFHLVPLS